jgi:hypothetical protein
VADLVNVSSLSGRAHRVGSAVYVIAETIGYTVTRPPRLAIGELLVRPTAQGTPQ